MSTITTSELAQLIRDTAKRHHHAYAEADGADPEWGLWYAGDLQARLWEQAGKLPSRSELCHLLLEAAKQPSDSAGDFADSYAAFILDALQQEQ